MDIFEPTEVLEGPGGSTVGRIGGERPAKRSRRDQRKSLKERLQLYFCQLLVNRTNQLKPHPLIGFAWIVGVLLRILRISLAVKTNMDPEDGAVCYGSWS